MEALRTFVVVRVAGLAVVVGLTVPGCADANPSPPAATSTPAATSASVAAARTDLFDPLVYPATIGWLPAGMVHHVTRISTDQFELLYLNGESRTPGALPVAEVHLQVWPAGLATWQQPGAEQYAYQDSTPVNGASAQWRQLGGRSGALRWQHRRDAWAHLRVHGLAGDPHATAQRIAQSVRFDTTPPVRLPWRLTGLPTGLTVRSVQVIEDNSYQPWRAEIAFHGSAVDPRPGPWLILRAHRGPESPDPAALPQPNTTVRGHPARYTRSRDGGDGLVIFLNEIVHQLYASVAGVALLGPAGLHGLADRIEFLGDPPTWSTAR